MAPYLAIIMVVSGILGFLLLIASSVIVDQFNTTVSSSFCNNRLVGVYCEFLDGTKAAGALGIIASLIQLGFCAFIIFFHVHRGVDLSSLRMKIFVCHVVILGVILISFSVGVHYQSLLTGPHSTIARYQFLNAVAGLDWIFCLGAVVVAWLSPGGSHTQAVEDVPPPRMPPENGAGKTLGRKDTDDTMYD